MATATVPRRRIKLKRPRLYRKQNDALFHDKRIGVVEASTKAGKTVGCLAWLLEKAALGAPGQNFWWVAPVYSQTEIAFRRMRKSLPEQYGRPHNQKLTYDLVNGTTIWFKSALKPDNLYGEDVYACVIDEASRMREASWHAVRSTLTATQGPIRIIGNVRGRTNWAYRLARQAEAGDSAFMHYAKITAADAVAAGVLSQSEIDEARAVLPEDVFLELYYAIASEDGNNPFGLEKIRACTMGENWLSRGTPVCYGVDLAKEVDWTVIIGLDDNMDVCEFHRFQKSWEETYRDVLDICGNVPTLCDMTGVGNPVVERLNAESMSDNFAGHKFSNPSKLDMVQGLRHVIRMEETRFPDNEIAFELEMFERTYTPGGLPRFEAPDGLHDDCVSAYMLAVDHFYHAETSFNSDWL